MRITFAILTSLVLARASADTTVPALRKALDDPRPDVRARSLRILSTLGPAARPAMPAAVRLLQDSDTEVRGNAAYMIAAAGSDVAFLPELMAAWKRAEPGDGDFIALAIARIGPAAAPAAPMLARHVELMLADGRAARLQSLQTPIHALGAIRSPEGVPALTACLRGGGGVWAGRAIAALAEMGAPARGALPALQEMSRDATVEPPLRVSACEAVAATGDPSNMDPACVATALAVPADEVRLRGARLAVKLGPAASPHADAVARLLLRVSGRTRSSPALATALATALGTMDVRSDTIDRALVAAASSGDPAPQRAAREAQETLSRAPVRESTPPVPDTVPPALAEPSDPELDVYAAVLAHAIRQRELPPDRVACIVGEKRADGSRQPLPEALLRRIDGAHEHLRLASSCVATASSSYIDDDTGAVATLFTVGAIQWLDDTHAVVAGSHYDAPLAAGGANYRLEWCDGRWIVAGANKSWMS